MQAKPQTRLLHILIYLWKNTDEEHIATLSDIVAYLSGIGIETTHKTVASDILLLEELGIDVICNKSTQNRYFLGSRVFEIAEVKMLVDAIQAAQFIPEARTKELIKKLETFSSTHQASELRRNLVTSKPKGDNNRFLYTVDMLNTAISQRKQVRFQYVEYNSKGKKSLKYDGYTYTYSPIAIVWNMDSYYVVGFSKKHDRVIKFRIDKIVGLKITDDEAIPVPSDLDLSGLFQTMFLMYGDEQQSVTLRCTNDVIGRVIDKFGEDIDITPVDDGHFEITENVMVGSTFFSWMFNYGGKIRIVSPASAKQAFKDMLCCFDEDENGDEDIPF